MKIAICMVHPFADGNGRLSRFVMAWDFISAGRPPLLIPTSVREAAAKGMDAIWFDGDASPLLEAARQGVEETTRLLAVLD
jgi:Fic family protein